MGEMNTVYAYYHVCNVMSTLSLDKIIPLPQELKCLIVLTVADKELFNF